MNIGYFLGSFIGGALVWWHTTTTIVDKVFSDCVSHKIKIETCYEITGKKK